MGAAEESKVRDDAPAKLRDDDAADGATKSAPKPANGDKPSSGLEALAVDREKRRGKDSEPPSDRESEREEKREERVSEKVERTEKGDRERERGDRPEKLEKKEEKSERSEKVERAEKGERVEKGERPDKTDKTEKAERLERIERRRERAIESYEFEIPSIPPPAPSGPWKSYKESVASLAARIVEAQRPIRVLQSIRWDSAVEEQFFKGKCRELPKVGPDHYLRNDLGFDPKAKAEEFEEIARDIDRDLGESDAIGDIMQRTALEYRDTVRMLAVRGTPHFYAFARRLYGSTNDTFPDGKTTVKDLGHMLYDILTNVDERALGLGMERTIPAPEAAAELNKRFANYFGDDTVRVAVDDDIVSDAAAGSDYVKVRSGALFSPRDIDILEAHEGWVHVATSLNGQAQPVAKWLSKGPPRTTAVQEGLAALVEIFTFRTYPRRARKLVDRILAVNKAEDGANFLDVFEWYRTEGYEEDECFQNTVRVFRGGDVEGGAPFTKDACYCKGIMLNYAFLQSAVRHNRTDLVPYLFAGKVAHEDVPVLAMRVNDGVVKPPRYVPPMFRDLSGLSIWMAFSSFFSKLRGNEMLEYYGKLFKRAG
jgi:uncharacterized protein (TIGR02421 family)